jgi:hypothetical protein
MIDTQSQARRQRHGGVTLGRRRREIDEYTRLLEKGGGAMRSTGSRVVPGPTAPINGGTWRWRRSASRSAVDVSHSSVG